MNELHQTPTPEQKKFRIMVEQPVSEKSPDHENQDRAAVFEVPRGVLLIVCDGVGAHTESAQAAELFIETVQEILAEEPLPPSDGEKFEYAYFANGPQADTVPDRRVDFQHMYMQKIFQTAHERLQTNIQEKGATTATIIYIEREPVPRASVYWVGDSPVFLQRRNETTVLPLTIPDSLLTKFALDHGKTPRDMLMFENTVGQSSDRMTIFSAFIQRIKTDVDIQTLHDEKGREFLSIEKLHPGLVRAVGDDVTRVLIPNVHRINLSVGDRVRGMSDGASNALTLRAIAACASAEALVAKARAATDELHTDDDITAVEATLIAAA